MNTAYPLFPVTLIIILAYFISRIFRSWYIVSLKWHRKLWNYLLLITFLVSGILGIVSVVKVNYKLSIPFYNTIMQWHVSLGIAMVIIAFFHLSWHWRYFLNIKTSNKESLRIAPTEDLIARRLKTFLILLGIITIISQVIFIREFIGALSGNELIVGIVLSVWMLLTGWGALHARKLNISAFGIKKAIRMFTFLTIYPMAAILLLYLLKHQLFPPGTLISIGYSVLATFIFLFPFCFLSGYLFTVFSSSFSESKSGNLIGRAYALESLGSLIGGLLLSFAFARLFNSIQIFALCTAAVWLIGTFYSLKSIKKYSWYLGVGAILFLILVFSFKPYKLITKLAFPNQEVVHNTTTPYGNLVVGKQVDQLNIYENSSLQFYTQNLMSNEEAVHFAMVQHSDPKQVLLLSGGIAGMIDELLKYDVNNIEYLESNPYLFKGLKDHAPKNLDSDKVTIIRKDIRKFVTQSDKQYDVILMNLPEPSSLGLNRFYTLEFFQLLKKHCNDQTVICTGLPSTVNYAERNALGANASLWNTLKYVFDHTLLLTGERNYFLASDAKLNSSICSLISEKQIATEYVNEYYINDELLTQRSKQLIALFDNDIPINRDFCPYIFFKQIQHWLSFYGSKYYMLILIPAVLFLLGFIKTNPITMGLYTGGFTAASLEVVLLLVYQIYFGSIYIATALFFAIFMGGLALGSSGKISFKSSNTKIYSIIQFSLAALAILLPVFIKLGSELTNWQWLFQFIFFILIFLVSLMVGFEFFTASKIRLVNYKYTAGTNYSTDLAGSAFGAFLTAIMLLPLLGVLKTCLVVAVLNMVSGSFAMGIKDG